MKFFTRFDHAPGVVFKSQKPPLTDPQYKQDCDINAIVARALRGSVPDYLVRRPGGFGDVSKFADFRQMMDTVVAGTAAFLDVPSEIRARFGNDARAFFEFACDPANSEEMIRLGLATRHVEAVEAPVKVEVVSGSTNPKAPA